MRLCWAIFFAGAIATQTGCRVFERGSRERDRPTANPASRTRSPTPGWPYELPRDRGPSPNSRAPGNLLEPPAVPQSNVRVPPAGTWADPTSKNYDYRTASQRIISGYVETPEGQMIENTYVSVEFADPTKNAPGAPVGVQTDRGGYFLIQGLKPSETYILTAKVNMSGRNLVGRQFVTVPNERVKIQLRDDFGVAPYTGPTGDLPSGRSAPAVPPSGSGGVLPLPPLFDSPGGSLPFPTENSGGAYSPVPTPPPVRGDLVAPGPTPDFRSVLPPVAIPGPGSPSVLPLPTVVTPGSTSRSIDAKFEVRLLDLAGKETQLSTGREADLQLLAFVSTDCKHSLRAMATLAEIHENYRERALRVVGIVCDEGSERERTRFAEVLKADRRLPFEMYLEVSPGKVQDAFQIQSYPTLVLIDGTGRKLWRGHPKNADELDRTIRDFIDSRK